MVVRWADVCADAIHAADPEALVSTGLFAFAAVGRSGPGTLSADKTGDARIPARPLALLRSKLDYVDVHLYAWMGENLTVAQNLRRALESVEAAALMGEARRVGKPVLCGECGVFANYLRKPADLAIDHALGLACLREHVQGVRDAGFAGALYWPYGSPDSGPNDEMPALNLFPEYATVLTGIWGP
jgi:hypothetical protein